MIVWRSLGNTLCAALCVMGSVLPSLCTVGAQERAPHVAADDERARVHFEAGESYFAEQRFDDAAREFGEAFALSGRPEMLVNQARALERAGRTDDAIAALSLLLTRYPRSSYRPDVEATIARLQAQASVEVTKETPPTTPVAEPPEAERVEEPGPEARRLWPPTLWPLVLGSSALAAGVVSLATGLRAHTLHGDLDERCAGGLCAARDDDDITKGRRLARTSTSLTFGAVALAGAAGILYWLDVRTPRKGPALDAALGKHTWEARLRWEM